MKHNIPRGSFKGQRFGGFNSTRAFRAIVGKSLHLPQIDGHNHSPSVAEQKMFPEKEVLRLRSLNFHDITDNDCSLVRDAKKLLWTTKNSISANR